MRTGHRVKHIQLGKVTVAELQAQAKEGLQKIPIDDDNIGAFEPIARKYGITYALAKDESEEPPKWAASLAALERLNFRAKDSEVLNVAFAEFTKQALSPEQEKPSAPEQIRKFTAKLAERVTHRNRGKVRERSGPEL